MVVQVQQRVEELLEHLDKHLIIFQRKTSLKKKHGARFLGEMDSDFPFVHSQMDDSIKDIIFHLQSHGLEVENQIPCLFGSIIQP